MRKRRSMLSYLLLILISLVSLAPFYLMVVMSTYLTEDIFKGLPLLPSNHFAENMATVLKSNFGLTYLNSIIISLTSTVACVLISAMAGYGLNAYNFKLKKPIYNTVLLTMMVPTQIGIIGYMIEMRTMHLQATLWPMILLWFANGFGVFWMTQYIRGSLPMEIVESARIDGCHELGTFFRIVLPCIVPALTTLALLIFLWSWNNYLVPLVFVNNAKQNTIPVFIKALGNAYRTDYGAQLAGLVVSTIPLILMFVLGSKSFIKGLTAGAVKG